MGFGVGRFVSSVDQNIICSICSAVLEEAVLTPCGHSFCGNCLDIWLARPGRAKTCPECRGNVRVEDVRPIHSIRNLVNAMDVCCENKDRGCPLTMKVEELKYHIKVCEFAPMECAGCGVIVHRIAMPEHHIECEVLQSLILETQSPPEDTRGGDVTNSNNTSEIQTNQVEELSNRVSMLELQLKQVRRDLHLADTKNKRLDKELRKTRKDLEDRRLQLTQQQYFVEFDPDYDYGYTPESVLKLSVFISKFLQQKPVYVDSDRVFDSLKRCFEHFGGPGHSKEHEVHMLLATAYASNWLSRAQRLSVHCWMQSTFEYKKFLCAQQIDPSSSYKQ